MIWLTNAALRYAADVCAEVPDYVVTVYTNSRGEYDDIRHKLRSFIKNKGATINDILNWHIAFNNDSKINVSCADLIPLGHRSNLAIVSRGVEPDIIRHLLATEFNRTPDGAPFPFADAMDVENTPFIEGERGEEHVAPTNTGRAAAFNNDLRERMEELRTRINAAEIERHIVAPRDDTGAQPATNMNTTGTTTGLRFTWPNTAEATIDWAPPTTTTNTYTVTTAAAGTIPEELTWDF